MRVAQGSEGLDIIALVEQQPALLLQADTPVSSDEEETAAERLQVLAAADWAVGAGKKVGAAAACCPPSGPVWLS